MPALQTVAFLRMAVSGSRAPFADFSRLDRETSPRSPDVPVCELQGGSHWTRPRRFCTLALGKHNLPPSAALASALARALARRPSPASALPLCVPNLPPWQQCGWCESPRGRSHYKRPQAERPLAPRAGNAGAGQAAPPPPTSPPSPPASRFPACTRGFAAILSPHRILTFHPVPGVWHSRSLEEDGLLSDGVNRDQATTHIEDLRGDRGAKQGGAGWGGGAHIQQTENRNKMRFATTRPSVPPQPNTEYGKGFNRDLLTRMGTWPLR